MLINIIQVTSPLLFSFFVAKETQFFVPLLQFP